MQKMKYKILKIGFTFCKFIKTNKTYLNFDTRLRTNIEIPKKYFLKIKIKMESVITFCYEIIKLFIINYKNNNQKINFNTLLLWRQKLIINKI